MSATPPPTRPRPLSGARRAGGGSEPPRPGRATWLLVAPVPALLVVGGNKVSGSVLDLQLVQLLCLAVIAACLFVVLLRLAGRQRLPAALGVLPVLSLLFIGVTMTTAVVGVSPLTFASVSVTTVLAVGYAVCVAFTVRSRQQVENLLLVFIVGATLVLVPALQQTGQATSQLGGAVISNRPVGRLADPNELGALSAIVFVLSVAALSHARARVYRVVALLCVLVSLGTLLLSFSRTSWFAAGLGFLVLLAQRGVRRQCVRTLVPTLFVAFLTISILDLGFPLQIVVERLSSLDSFQSNPSDARPLIWQTAIQLTWDRPVLGWGPGTFTQVASSPPSSLWAYPVRHAHDGPLTILVENGIVGLAVILTFAVLLVRSLVQLHRRDLRTGNRAGSWLPVAMLACLATMGGGLVADYTLRSPLIHVCTWFVAGLSMAVVRVGQTQRHDLPPGDR